MLEDDGSSVDLMTAVIKGDTGGKANRDLDTWFVFLNVCC